MIINKKIRKIVFVICLSTLLLILSLNLFAQTPQAAKPEAPSATNPSAIDILRMSMKALSNLSAVEYEVTMDEERMLFSSDRSKIRAKTKIIAANSPLRAVAKLQGEDGITYETLVLNDKIMQFSAAGETGENDTSKGFKPLVALGDLRNTWQLLLDQNYLGNIIEKGRFLFGGQERIDGDLCNVVIHVTSNPARNSISTNYYWISAETNLPRAAQVLSMNEGRTALLPRRILNITKLNPPVTPTTFAYKPTEKDSVIPKSASTPKSSFEKQAKKIDGPIQNLIGRQLPEIAAENLSYQKIKFAEVIRKPTLITFWATWCVPCLEEMPSFQKLVDKYQGKFQVLAVSTSELTRANAIEFIGKHPEYKFTFLIDPDWQKEYSVIKNALGIEALPTNLLVDSNGKIVSAWLGERNHAEWAALIDNLVTK